MYTGGPANLCAFYAGVTRLSKLSKKLQTCNLRGKVRTCRSSFNQLLKGRENKESTEPIAEHPGSFCY